MRVPIQHLKWPLALALAALLAGAVHLGLTRGEAILLDLSAALIACF
jgi:hypothetical protein